jgi:putative endonuclease
MDERIYCVYITTNERRTVLYTGVTGDLKKRIFEHKTGVPGGFSSRYNARRLVYFEIGSDALAAIAREKQIKGGSRMKKMKLVASMNPEWRDLYDDI